MDHLHDEFHIPKYKPSPAPDDGKRLGGTDIPSRINQRVDLVQSKLDAILALVGSLKYDVGVLSNKMSQIEHEYLMTPEKKVEMFEKAKKQFEKLKLESEQEIEEILKRRAEAGIPDGGDRVTEADLRDLDRHEA